MYNEKIYSILKNPKNVGMIKGASGQGEAGDANFSDVIKFYISVEDDVITDIKYKAYGGVLAIVVGSTFTTFAKNKKINDALKISIEDIMKVIGQVDEITSINICLDAFRNCVNNYYEKIEKENNL